MTDLRVKHSISDVLRAIGDGEWMDARGTRDGALIKVGYLQGLAMEGRVFGVNTGTGSSPDTFNATYAAAEPDLMVSAPSGVAIIPIMVEVATEDTGTVAVYDVVAVATTIYGITGLTSTACTPYNLRTDAVRKSRCTCNAVVTGGGSTPLATNYVEFFRGGGGLAEDAFNGSTAPTNELVSRIAWNVGDALVPPVIVGEGSLYVYASGQAAKGWITAIWAEIPSNDID